VEDCQKGLESKECPNSWSTTELIAPSLQDNYISGQPEEGLKAKKPKAALFPSKRMSK